MAVSWKVTAMVPEEPPPPELEPEPVPVPSAPVWMAMALRADIVVVNVPSAATVILDTKLNGNRVAGIQLKLTIALHMSSRSEHLR